MEALECNRLSYLSFHSFILFASFLFLVADGKESYMTELQEKSSKIEQQ